MVGWRVDSHVEGQETRKLRNLKCVSQQPVEPTHDVHRCSLCGNNVSYFLSTTGAAFDRYFDPVAPEFVQLFTASMTFDPNTRNKRCARPECTARAFEQVNRLQHFADHGLADCVAEAMVRRSKGSQRAVAGDLREQALPALPPVTAATATNPITAAALASNREAWVSFFTATLYTLPMEGVCRRDHTNGGLPTTQSVMMMDVDSARALLLRTPSDNEADTNSTPPPAPPASKRSRRGTKKPRRTKGHRGRRTAAAAAVATAGVYIHPGAVVYNAWMRLAKAFLCSTSKNRGVTTAAEKLRQVYDCPAFNKSVLPFLQRLFRQILQEHVRGHGHVEFVRAQPHQAYARFDVEAGLLRVELQRAMQARERAVSTLNWRLLDAAPERRDVRSSTEVVRVHEPDSGQLVFPVYLTGDVLPEPLRFVVNEALVPIGGGGASGGGGGRGDSLARYVVECVARLNAENARIRMFRQMYTTMRRTCLSRHVTLVRAQTPPLPSTDAATANAGAGGGSAGSTSGGTNDTDDDKENRSPQLASMNATAAAMTAAVLGRRTPGRAMQMHTP